MRIAVVVLLSLSAIASAAEAPRTFEERERLARQVEEQPSTQKYLYEGMYPHIGSAMAGAMKSCLADANTSTEQFTLVADVATDGTFAEVAVRPTTNTAQCFAVAFRQLRSAPPPTCDCGPLPIVIDMKIKP